MGLLDGLAHFFLGGRDDNNEHPSQQDYDAAEATYKLISEYGDQFDEADRDIGTVPATPREYEGEDTDPEHPVVSSDPWWKFWQL